MRKAVSFFLFSFFLFGMVGCTTNQSIVLSPAGSTLPLDNFKAGSFTNETSETALSDYEGYFKEELEKALKKRNVTIATDDAGIIVLNTRILDYKPGNAFKRWLMPGWGKTICAAQVDVLENPGEQKRGMISVRRSIGFGGAYTIGAHRTVFKDLAEAIAKQVETKLAH